MKLKEQNDKKLLLEKTMLFLSVIILLTTFFFIIHQNNIGEKAIFNVESLKLYNENYSSISTSVSVEKEVKPDYFTINIGVKETTNNIEEGKNIVAEKINSIRKELLKSGIKKEEIETLNFNIYKNYYWFEGEKKIKNYSVSQTLKIKSHNLDLAGKVIDVSVKEGANSISSLYFGLDEKKIDEYKEELLKEAVKKAYRQARIIAENGNLNLKGIKSLNINNYNYRPYYAYAKTEMLDVTKDSNVKVDEQKQKVNVNINVVFNAEMK